MARHFISPDLTLTALDNGLAEAADHSTDIDHAHYGRAFGDPCLTHSTWKGSNRYARNGTLSWAQAFPVQEPIVSTRAHGTSRLAKETVKPALVEMLPELSALVAHAVVEKLSLQGSLPWVLTTESGAQQVTGSSCNPAASDSSRPLNTVKSTAGNSVEAAGSGLDLSSTTDLNLNLGHPSTASDRSPLRCINKRKAVETDAPRFTVYNQATPHNKQLLTSS